ncbi:hypothetical protein FOZ60_011681 [Perkinsus olseni]|uniref:subtilisin n=1 Tax=Perkinsus olseni TaxID=32597 RepID=A0A7J6NCY1_PEROL|nr:hypothetical protein FOZ60_011681 [Perkinsus olseni]
MKPTFVLLFLLAVAEGYHREDIPRRRLSDIVYREYRTGDKMDNGEDLTRCEEPDEPCYVAVDQAISAKTVIAVVKMTIPDDPVDEVEKMIREHMPHPSQAGEIGVIDWIGAKKSQVVAMHLVVNPKNNEAIGLYEKTGFVKVGVEDHFGHGTAMASIIASNINNGVGIAGIADKVLIRPIRMSEKGTEAAFERVVRAWEAALTFADTDIILYSAGGWFDQDRSVIYKFALEQAVKKGILVLTAAPNSDNVDGPEEVELPCALANGISGVLCIATTVTSDPFTALGDAAKLASFGMPGTNVTYPTPIRDGDVWRYAKGQGSSVAAAAAAGIAVLIKGFKNFAPQEIERILLNSTEGRVRTKAGDEMSYGLLRPEVAIEQAIAEATWSQVA